MKAKNKKKIKIGVYEYSERELAQIIRRKMISKSIKNKKKYNRKSNKTKNSINE